MLGGGILYDLRGELALIGNRKSCGNDLTNCRAAAFSFGKTMGALRLSN